jgi:hypothetical protein
MRLRNREWAANALRIDKVASECTALSSGDPVMCYLERRRCLGERPAPATLRLHPGLGYWEADRLIGTFPAMVAPLVAPDGRTVALHRTFLTDDGQKAPVPSAKKLTPAAGPIRGASIRLFGPERGVLGIAEGIETAMAATCASGVPTVAAYCADALAAWIWPPLVDHLIIFGDADKRGRDAAEALRQRALASGLRCRTLTPAVDGADWCDVWGTRPDRIAPNGGADDRDF